MVVPMVVSMAIPMAVPMAVVVPMVVVLIVVPMVAPMVIPMVVPMIVQTVVLMVSRRGRRGSGRGKRNLVRPPVAQRAGGIVLRVRAMAGAAGTSSATMASLALVPVATSAGSAVAEVIGVDPFDGASGASRAEPMSLHVCRECEISRANWSAFAYVNANNQFAARLDAKTTVGIDAITGVQFTNQYSASESGIVLKCYECVGRAHGVDYLDKANGKLTGQWQNMAKRTKGKSLPPSKIKRICKGLQRSGALENSDAPSADEAHAFLTKHQAARAATNWVPQLSEFTLLLCGCGGCKMYPLRSSCWWRAVKRDCENRPGMSRTDGHWRCANCCVRWGGDTWKERLLVIDVGDDDDRFLMFYIGDDVGADEESKIQLLKASKLVSVLDGKPVTVDTLKAAIVQCNDEAEKRLGSMACVRQLTTVDPRQKGFDVTVYCEDEALELRRPGTEYRAIDLGALQDSVEKLTKAELSL